MKPIMALTSEADAGFGSGLSESNASLFPYNTTDSQFMNFSHELDYNNYSYYDQEVSWEHLYYYYLWTYVAPALLGSITVIGTIGNSLVIYVILSGKVMRSVTNILLLNLAITDIAFLLVCAPVKAHKYAAMDWTLGDIMCKVVQYLAYVASYVTVWSLVSISAIRFLTVVYSTSTAKVRTKRNVIILICMIWLISLSGNIPAMMAYIKKTIGTYSYCGMVEGSMEKVFLSFFILSYVLPLLIICVLYVLIMLHLQQVTSKVNSTQVRTQGRTAKACKVIIAVVLMFAISWLPYHVNILVGLYGKAPAGAYYEAFRILWDCMAYSNSCVNPIIYNYVSNDFRKAFQEVICCCKWRKSPVNQNGRMVERPTETEMTQMLETKA